MKNLAKIVIEMLLVLMIFAASSAAADSLKKGMNFFTARKLLIHDDWRPINVHEKEDYPYSAVEKELKDIGIEELESCAMDKALCLFNYKKNKKCLLLETLGEEINDMQIYYWTYKSLKVMPMAVSVAKPSERDGFIPS